MAVVAAACGRLGGGWVSLQVGGRRLIHTAWRITEGAGWRWLLGESPGFVVHVLSLSFVSLLIFLRSSWRQS